MNKTLVSGWAVAAAVSAAWWATCTFGGGGEVADAPTPAGGHAVVESRGGGGGVAASSCDGLPLEPWQRGVKMKSKDLDWNPKYLNFYHPDKLRLLLGDVPPDVRKLADRICELYLLPENPEVNHSLNYGQVLACVPEAAACPNPIVRLMMIRLLAQTSNCSKDFVDLQDKLAIDEGRNAFASSFIDTLVPFLDDSNGYVSEQAFITLEEAFGNFADFDSASWPVSRRPASPQTAMRRPCSFPPSCRGLIGKQRPKWARQPFENS